VSTSINERFRSRVFAGGAPLLLPGAGDAMVARLLEDAGAEAVYVSGAGITNTYLGMPDLGLLTATELAAQVAAIRDVVDLPLVVDADTGFGNVVNVHRTVRALERAGANAIQIEDQSMPKKCGHFAGKSVVEPREMAQRIHAAVDARHDQNLLIIARTDARAELGLDHALERAHAYREAGADVIFVEAPETVDELGRIAASVPGPLVANMVEGGLTPLVPLARLAELGFSIVLYANSVMRGGLTGMRAVAEHLLKEGDTLGVQDRIAGWDLRQSLVRKHFYDEMVDRYEALTATPAAAPPPAAEPVGAGE
jgi:2-methylisocitrate lyase-like PEP mutase family enzyme